ncbi:glycosyltransferase [Sphingomonas aerolata]|uniref:glycosyltransferase n=1 Tax=Sphingomonas aerolata TaxID=185951 RepID=UPI002FE3859B
MTVAGRHIAIIAPPTAGHLNPLVALGTSLVAAGHRVTLVHMADVAAMLPRGDVAFAPLDHPADRQGLLAEHYRKLAQPSGPVGLPRMIRSTAAMTELLLAALPATLTRLGVNAVVADSVEPAGALVARHLGLPFVTAITGLPLLREPMIPPPFLGWAYRADALGRNRNNGGYAVSDLLMRPVTRIVTTYAQLWGSIPIHSSNGRTACRSRNAPQGSTFRAPPCHRASGTVRRGASTNPWTTSPKATADR